MNRKSNILAAFLAAALSASLLCGCNGGKDSSSDTQQAVTQSAQADSSNIQISGFETLDFKAGNEENAFYTEQANCAFCVLLISGKAALL